MSQARAAAVNVDIDGLHLYYRIHGLADPPAAGSVWSTGVARFLDLFARHGLRATFFVVTEDLAHDEVRNWARKALDAGHELASHSHTHAYDLSQWPQARIEGELETSRDTLKGLTGEAPRGFRAPGYNLSPALLKAVARTGFAYDSSAFPCPPYLLARAAAIGAYGLMGRPSQSIVGPPAAAFGRTAPHIVSGGTGTLAELPISVFSPLRIPLIGTSLIAGGRAFWRLARGFVDRLDFLNLEFHAVDMTDHERDGISEALRAQPDQRVPLVRKEALFDEVLGHIAGGWNNCTLAEYTSSMVQAGGHR